VSQKVAPKTFFRYFLPRWTCVIENCPNYCPNIFLRLHQFSSIYLITITQPSYLYNLISVQLHCDTRSSDIVTLSRPPSSSSLGVNNRSFCHASPCLWSQLPKKLRLPTDHEDLSLSSDLTHISSSFPSSPLSPSITPSLFHSRLKTHLFHKSLLHSFSNFPPTGLTPRTPAAFRFSRACRF